MRKLLGFLLPLLSYAAAPAWLNDLRSSAIPVYDGKVAGKMECRVNVWLETQDNPARRVPPR